MKNITALVPFALALMAASAHAQAPLFIQLGPGTRPTDVSVSQANGLVVVGTTNGGAFRWTPAGGILVIGSAVAHGSTVRISSDGSTIVADQPAGTTIWNGTNWIPIPGLGGSSGGVDVVNGDVNADGTVIVGMGYSVSSIAHALRWNQGVGSTDLGPFFNSPQSRALGVNGDGTFIVGWQDGANRMGARWVNGVHSNFVYIDPSNVSHFTQMANAVNHNATIAVGRIIYGVSSVGWRWDAGTNAITPLPNFPLNSQSPVPNDLTDDGSIIVGNDGGTTLGGAIQALIWVQGQPEDPLVHYGNLGMAPTGFQELGNVTAISRDGNALVGAGVAGAPGQPEGWVIVFPHLLPVGTSFCAGDGSGTACPCGNNGSAGMGCASSSIASGARLGGGGTPSVTDGMDTLTLTATNVAGPGLFFQGSVEMSGGSGITFGDGLLCVTGSLVRLGVVFPTGTAASYPGGLTPQPIHNAGGPLIGGDVRHYQCWYRDAFAFCSPSTFNLTQGLTITWLP